MARKLTEQEQSTLTNIWNGLHENGQSHKAGELAQKKFHQLHDQKFDANEPNIYYIELARQVVVTNTAAARKEKLAVRAFPHLLRAGEAIVESYPLAHNAIDAKKRGAFWESSNNQNLDHHTGQTLRDTLHTLRALQMMFDDEGFDEQQKNIALAMNEVSRRFPDDRFALIGQIEEASLEQAQQAFTTFIQRFAPDRRLKPPSGGLSTRYETELIIPLSQLLTVSSRLIGRELRGKKLISAHNHRQELLQHISLYEAEMRRELESFYTPPERKAELASRLKNLPKLVAREQFAGVFRPVIDAIRTEQWQSELKNSRGAFQTDRLKPLKTLSHVGLSGDYALPLSRENR